METTNMNGKIYKIIDDDNLLEIREKKHKNENDFQRLIKKYPDLIPGDLIDNDNPRKWLVVGREINNIDVFLLDQDGMPTIVEVKKIDNDEIHRSVIAQLFDYGSKLFSKTIAQIRVDIDKYSPTDLETFLDNNDIEEEEFLEKLKMNIKEENMRLIVVSDGIPRNLQNIVEFLNNEMESIEVLAVEIKQYTDDQDGTKIFVPRLVGHSRDTTVFEPELREETLYENLDDVGALFYRELLQFANENNFEPKWTKTGFFLTVPIEEEYVKILHCYSDKYSFGQSIFSTNISIIDRVKAGEVIFEQYLKDSLEIDDFYTVNTNFGYLNFGYKVDRNLDEKQWEKFKINLLKIKEKIEENGLKTN